MTKNWQNHANIPLMSPDVVDMREFYVNPLGRKVRRLLRMRISKMWPDIKAKTILALGFATPLLRPWLEQAQAMLVVMPPEQGAAYWPKEGPNMTCLASSAALPLADESVDRVLVMHALETATEPDALLREAWRVLKGNGRMIAIVPNRRGFWAHSDRTPFGTGRPYSSSQLREALKEQGFLVETSRYALFMPPFTSKTALAASDAFELFGECFFPGLGGVLVIEASKQIYAPVLTKARAVKHRLVLPLPVAVPSGPVPARRV